MQLWFTISKTKTNAIVISNFLEHFCPNPINKMYLCDFNCCDTWHVFNLQRAFKII